MPIILIHSLVGAKIGAKHMTLLQEKGVLEIKGPDHLKPSVALKVGVTQYSTTREMG